MNSRLFKARFALALALTFCLGAFGVFADDGVVDPPRGFIRLFNGEDLSGWKGLVKNPVARSKMSPA